jgi:hypothetical protein
MTVSVSEFCHPNSFAFTNHLDVAEPESGSSRVGHMIVVAWSMGIFERGTDGLFPIAASDPRIQKIFKDLVLEGTSKLGAEGA